VYSQYDIIGEYSGCLVKTRNQKCNSQLNLKLKSDSVFEAIINRNGSVDSVAGNWYISENDRRRLDSIIGDRPIRDSVLYLKQFINPEKLSLFYTLQDTLSKLDYYSGMNLLKLNNFENQKSLIQIYSENGFRVDTLNFQGELYYRDIADSIFICYENNKIKIIPKKINTPYILKVNLHYEYVRLRDRFTISKKGKLEYIRYYGNPIATDCKKRMKTLNKVE